MKIPLPVVFAGVLICFLTGSCSSHLMMNRQLEKSFRLDRKKKMNDQAFDS